MTVRTVGVEEELLLVDPDTREPAHRAAEVLKILRDEASGGTSGRGTAADDVDRELFRHQLETRTDPATDLADIRTQLVAARRTAGTAARRAGLAAVASGTSPLATTAVRVSRDQRYQTMSDTFGAVASSGGTCGMHVHVAVESDDEGVVVLDRIGPWLPVLLAMSSNSPYADGLDTGHASWRAQLWGRWPSAGPLSPVGSVAAYRELADELIGLGAALDTGMLYFDARLSEAHPTVEVRVCDVATDVEHACLVAALVRGLVERAAAAPDPRVEGWRPELLRAAHWRASRHGLASTLAHPVTRRPAPAAEVVAALVAHVEPALVEAGDLDLVRSGVDRLLAGGGGAARQRAAYERSGTLEHVVDDLVARTEQTWERIEESGPG
ncbi:glutamate--cysteine ligase [Nocardioides sp. SYSU D00038]|uniref:carboxylate-amine ligase n=1 Tax=Nocardioides sp. SYSU D00038 TaxID=2812554 RepID=UPI00196833FE|nr:glutamate--cysteine ligase [Nocardioides sp. SYSU D00038]